MRNYKNLSICSLFFFMFSLLFFIFRFQENKRCACRYQCCAFCLGSGTRNLIHNASEIKIRLPTPTTTNEAKRWCGLQTTGRTLTLSCSKPSCGDNVIAIMIVVLSQHRLFRCCCWNPSSTPSSSHMVENVLELLIIFVVFRYLVLIF